MPVTQSRSLLNRKQETENGTSPIQMHLPTPLLLSPHLSSLVHRDVYLKMENVQPSGSYKIRGHGHLCACEVQSGTRKLISSSGGNAGAAVAYAAKQLGVESVVVVPNTTPNFMVKKLRNLGATVEVVGNVWDESDSYARKLVAASFGTAAYVPPFDDERLWTGIASMIHELHSDLNGEKPACIVVAVGGGGLFCGTALGCAQIEGWDDVPIIAAETEGADSFAAMLSNNGETKRLEEISSLAKSLGALEVSDECGRWVKKGRSIRSVVVSDREAVEACSILAVHHRILVEVACGAALAALFREDSLTELRSGPVVVVVCGGNMVSPELLDQWIQVTNATKSSL